MVTIVWFRQDLRTVDNPALSAACAQGAVIPLYIIPEENATWSMGGASRWWLHHSLESLKADLEKINLSLVIRTGNPLDILRTVIKETGATSVFWNRCYEQAALKEAQKIKETLHEEDLDVKSFNANLLFEPWTIANKQGKPFQVFTPFWKTCLAKAAPEKPLPIPKPKESFSKKIHTESIDSLKLLPRIHWDTGIQKAWKPGTDHALTHLEHFFKNSVLDYTEARDFPEMDGTSKMSPYMHFGEISPRMIWHAALNSKDEALVAPYLRQLGWREFAHHLLYHFPFTSKQPLRKEFSHFPWKKDAKHLKAWQTGNTGYPFVDAGMRQLWTTGWMHNRVRMVVGSFLVKDLLLPWQSGAEWFWDTLVDADLANNTLGWQWVGGCGADAAPYFRIFNPITQGEKFDDEGRYIRQWVPELAKLPNKWIHKPWEAPAEILEYAKVTLGKDYPMPIIDHKKAREEALKAFSHLRSEGE